MDTLVPLLREVEDPVPLVTFQGNYVIPPPLSTDLSCKPGEGSGGVWSCYAWSGGLGFETLPIKTRSARKKASLPSITPDVNTTSFSDNGALRGLKSLGREKI